MEVFPPEDKIILTEVREFPTEAGTILSQAGTIPTEDKMIPTGEEIIPIEANTSDGLAIKGFAM